MNKMQKVYKILLESYSHQGWWPVTPTGGCRGDLPDKPIYGVGVKTERQRLEVIFGALLTQNTAWKNVEKALINLNKAKLIDIRKIRAVSRQKLASLIKPAGYFNQKAERLKIIARHLYDNYKGNLRAFFNQDTLRLREELLSIKGVGPETADSILLYAGDKPVFVVDAYTKRIFSRIGLCKEDDSYEDVQELFQNSLEKDAKLFNEYHALIVEHAKRFCMKKPLCGKCALFKICKRVRV